MELDYGDKLAQIEQRSPGINGKKDYYNGAVLALLVSLQGEYHFIFEKRSNSVSQPGQICFPGGLYEPSQDKDFRQTALRETREEIGIAPKDIKILTPLDIIVLQGLLTVDPFLAVAKIDGLDDLIIDKQEVAEVFTLPLAYFIDHEPESYKALIKLFPYEINELGEKEIIFPAAKFGLAEKYKEPWGKRYDKLLVYQIEDYVIWGITARIIKDVVKRIKEV